MYPLESPENLKYRFAWQARWACVWSEEVNYETNGTCWCECLLIFIANTMVWKLKASLTSKPVRKGRPEAQGNKIWGHQTSDGTEEGALCLRIDEMTRRMMTKSKELAAIGWATKCVDGWHNVSPNSFHLSICGVYAANLLIVYSGLEQFTREVSVEEKLCYDHAVSRNECW